MTKDKLNQRKGIMTKDKLEAMIRTQHVFNKDEKITAEEFDRLRLEAESTAATILNFDLNRVREMGKWRGDINHRPKFTGKEEIELMKSVFEQTVIWVEKWKSCINHPPSHFKDSVIVDYMKNIIMLGHIYNYLMLESFTKIKSEERDND